MFGIPGDGDRYITVRTDDKTVRTFDLSDPRDYADVITSLSYVMGYEDEQIADYLGLQVDEVTNQLDIFTDLADAVDHILTHIEAPNE